MTKEEFLKDFYCKFHDNEIAGVRRLRTQVYRKSNNELIDTRTYELDVLETNCSIEDSKLSGSTNQIDLDSFIDQVKRSHLDALLIDNFSPMDVEENPDLSNFFRLD